MKRRDQSGSDEQPKKPLTRDNLRKLLGIYRFMLPYKWSFFAGLLFLVVSSGVLLSFPYLLGKLMDVATGKSDWLLRDLNSIAALLLGILAVQSLFSFLRVILFARVSEQSMAKIRTALYDQYMRLPMPFFDQHRSGELLSRITSDITLLQDTFTITLAELIRQSVILIAGVVILFWHTPRLALFMLATFPVLIIGALFFGRYIRKMSRQTQDVLADTNVIVEETLQNIFTVKAFANESFEVNRYANAMQKVVQTALNTAKFRGGFISFIITAIFGGIILVMWYGAVMVSEGDITLGELTAFVLYTMFIGGSIGGLGDIYGSIQKAVGASERVLDMLAEPQEIPGGQPIPQRLRGDIRLENIRFAYPSRRETPVLQGLHLHVKAGEKVALVGHSGAGKSTVIQLLLRFYQPDQGQILVDGQPADQYALHDYRSQIAVVPQEVLLFGGSIRDNIAYGRPNATDEDIIRAARQAHAWEFITKFPEGLATVVGERGIKLSGGQRQRIAIARAMLKDPAILILDEATSSLDAESEQLVQQALTTLMEGRTTIVIAHRLSTVRRVDRIHVIQDGQIAEAGTHDQLLTQEDGLYAHFVRIQLEHGQTAPTP